MNIYQKLAEVQQALKVPKDRKNSHSGYMYRNCDDILEAFKKIANGCVIILQDSIEVVGDRHYVKATAIFAHPECESQVTASAYAREIEAKIGKGGTETMDRAQITGAASSYARKYALNGLLALDDSVDPDDDSYVSKDERSPNTTQPNPSSPKTISDAQMKRLMAIANEHGLTKEEQVAIVSGQFGFSSRKLITTDKYDAVVAAYMTVGAAEV